MIITSPGPSVCSALSSHFSPRAMANLPEITVTCSMAGCQCGGILPLFGILMRAMNGRASFMGPSRMAIFAPGIEGRSFQSRSLAIHILWAEAPGMVAGAAGALAAGGAAAGEAGLDLSCAASGPIASAAASAARRSVFDFIVSLLVPEWGGYSIIPWKPSEEDFHGSPHRSRCRRRILRVCPGRGRKGRRRRTVLRLRGGVRQADGRRNQGLL